MPDKPTTARISLAAILLRNAGYPDVAKFLLAKEKRAAHGTRPAKAKRADVVKDGRKVRGSRAYVNLQNPDIEYIEL